ncbi:MAG TPA: TonB-dependent receptor [Bacteroidales bacterium]|nr:TonB-dependent receptor [Bacteroidales bacterium]
MRKKMFFSNMVMRFTKWSHKGYGVFESFKTVVTIGVLPFSYCLLAMPMATFAQSDSVAITKNVDIEEVVVNARKKASTYSELTRVVRVVNRDELGQRKAMALGELLEQVAAIDIRQRGTHGVQADINLRGGSFDQVMVLLNGVNVSDPQTGHHNLNIPINIDAVDRIEILQGPGAREFGVGAFAGAINIITKPDGSGRGELSLFAGEYGLTKVSISQHIGSKNFRTFLATSYDKSDGFIENTDFKILNIYLHSSYSFNKAELNLFTGYQDKGFGANSFYTPKYPNQYEATRAILGSLSYDKIWKNFTVKAATYYRKHTDRFELFRTNLAEWYSGHNYHATDVYGSKLSLSRFYQWGKTDVGVELRREELLSNKLGSPLIDSVKVRGDDVYYTKGDSRNHLMAYASQNFFFKQFSFSVGGQFNHSNKFGDIWTWGADLSYDLYQQIRPFASVNRSFRLPTFTDLYYQGPTNMGNPYLHAEFATTYELGLRLNQNSLTAEVALFYRQGTDIIDWVKKANETVWTTVNYTKLNAWGSNINLSVNTKSLNIFTDRITLSYAYIESEKDKSELDSYYVLDYLRHCVTLNIQHAFKNLYLNWNLRYQDRNGEYLKYTDSNTSIPTSYPDVFLMDVRAGYVFKKVNIYFDVNNLFDSQYVDIDNVKQPGRWIGLGINYRFDLYAN